MSYGRVALAGFICLLTVSAATAQEPVAIRAGTLIDGTGAAPQQDVVLIVRGDRIEAVGRDIPVPADAPIVDLSDYTVLPGLVDAHVHIVGRHIGEGRNWEDAAVRDLPQEDAIRGVLSEGDEVGVQQYTEEELRTMVEEAAKLDHRVAAHAHGTEGIKAAVRAGVASIEHGSILDAEAVALIRERGTYLVPTLMAGYAVERQAREGILDGFRAEKALYIAPIMRRSFRMAVESGVPIAFGTDAGVFPHGTNAREFALMVENGMEAMDAIVSATSNGADLLGLAEDIGTLEPGKLADVIAVPGNPLDDMEVMGQVIFVMKAGQIHERHEAIRVSR